MAKDLRSESLFLVLVWVPLEDEILEDPPTSFQIFALRLVQLMVYLCDEI